MASIPFISALPLIGSDIIRDSGNIVIVKPEEFDCKTGSINAPCHIEDGPVKLVIMYNGHIVGQASSRFEINEGHIDYASIEIPMTYSPRMNVTASFEGGAYEQMMFKIYNSIKKGL